MSLCALLLLLPLPGTVVHDHRRALFSLPRPLPLRPLAPLLAAGCLVCLLLKHSERVCSVTCSFFLL
ncbi:hypothetical protein CY35_19G095900 [Sphagnum magellanicum]|nr:hypothetical protein CY35_19G095900 [Sphagnum magellanicum]